MQADITGYARFTADGAVKSSGAPVCVYGISFLSGGTAGVVILRDGTSTAGTSVIQENGVISSGKTENYPGVVFPSGCFVDIDANVTQVSVFYNSL